MRLRGGKWYRAYGTRSWYYYEFCYTLTKLPLPAMLALFTACVPWSLCGITIILALAIITLIIKGSYIAAIITLIIGGLVNFISDHIIKPNMISQAIELSYDTTWYY